MNRRRIGMALVVIGLLSAAIGGIGLAAGWGEVKDKLKGGPGESPQAFVQSYLAGLYDTTGQAMYDRLAPQVIRRYGEDQCREAAKTLPDTKASLGYLDISDAADFDFATDGKHQVIPNVYTLSVYGTLKGIKQERNFHLLKIHGRFRTFLDCGTPL